MQSEPVGAGEGETSPLVASAAPLPAGEPLLAEGGSGASQGPAAAAMGGAPGFGGGLEDRLSSAFVVALSESGQIPRLAQQQRRMPPGSNHHHGHNVGRFASQQQIRSPGLGGFVPPQQRSDGGLRGNPLR